MIRGTLPKGIALSKESTEGFSLSLLQDLLYRQSERYNYSEAIKPGKTPFLLLWLRNSLVRLVSYSG
jgi:hypothetical protein